jgi:predicted transcriptional regulator
MSVGNEAELRTSRPRARRHEFDILVDMKRILIDLDDRTARDLERVAPSRRRMRAEFVRMAIRAAIDRALDRDTAAAYERAPLGKHGLDDLAGWDPHNALAKRKRSRKKAA